MNVTLIGAGNVATVLGRRIKSAGHTVVEVFSRELSHAQVLAGELDAVAINDLKMLSQGADLFILSVADSGIVEIAETLRLPGKIVVHTSGAVSKNVLQNVSDGYGVLYPLQSLRKEADHIPVIPFLVDGNREAVSAAIQSFAQSISNKVSFCSDEQRLKLHVAAVVVANFSNHLYALTADYCKRESTDFSMLSPLIQEVANRVALYEPVNMQTGPAVRGDTGTIKKHFEMLEQYPELSKVYTMMTESIQKFYGSK